LRALICGGRDEKSRDYVWRGLDRIHQEREITIIAHGVARGVDALADAWAKQHKIRVIPYPALWAREGKMAGPSRNQRMLESFKPQIVIAFAGGRGTADMVRRAEKAGVEIVRIYRESTAIPFGVAQQEKVES
jgi:precorrin-6x reductase